jgi:hypothetical protein
MRATILISSAIAVTLQVQTCTTLVNFNGTNGFPPASLVQGADGDLCETASGGGTHGDGTIFKLSLS